MEVQYACQSPADQCNVSEDCDQGHCSLVDGARQCVPPGPVCGRPFLVEGAARLAELRSGSDWAGECACAAEALTPAERRLGVVASAREHIVPANPAEVLDRITIPNEAIERISELMGPGASLIVSDMPISHETNRGTDFVILTR